MLPDPSSAIKIVREHFMVLRTNHQSEFGPTTAHRFAWQRPLAAARASPLHLARPAAPKDVGYAHDAGTTSVALAAACGCRSPQRNCPPPRDSSTIDTSPAPNSPPQLPQRVPAVRPQGRRLPEGLRETVHHFGCRHTLPPSPKRAGEPARVARSRARRIKIAIGQNIGRPGAPRGCWPKTAKRQPSWDKSVSPVGTQT